MLYIPFDEILTTLRLALEKAGFDGARAARLADVFARNSLEGVYSHGVNRFPRFLKNVREGTVDRDAPCRSAWRAWGAWRYGTGTSARGRSSRRTRWRGPSS